MFAIIQFPIVDLRSFAFAYPRRVARPSFPQPVPYGPRYDREFLRGFGSARERRGDTDRAFGDDQKYCNAKHALRFVDLDAQRLDPDGRAVSVAGGFRRVFSDGKVVSRVEVGIGRPRGARDLKGLTAADCVKLAVGVMGLQSRVRRFDEGGGEPMAAIGYRPVAPLVGQGAALAELYFQATVPRQENKAPIPWTTLKAGRGFVEALPPLVIVEFEQDELDQFPAEARVDDADLATDSVGFLRVQPSTDSAESVETWFIRRDAASPINLRNLRLCLLGLHAQRLALNRVLNHVEGDRIMFEAGSPSGTKLAAFLKKSTRLLSSEKWFGIPQSAILQAFHAYEEVDRPGQLDLLRDKFQGVQEQVRDAVEAYERSRALAAGVGVFVGGVAAGGVLMTNTTTGNTYNISDTVAGAIGDQSQGTVNDPIVINQAAADQINVAQLRAALEALRAEAPKSGLPTPVVESVETATQAALDQGIQGDKVDAKSLVDNIKKAGDVIKATGETVEASKSLWEKVEDVAKIVGPIIGGAAKVAMWFGVLL
jgi:hypothetical protein